MKYITINECCKILDNKRIPVEKSNRINGPYPYYGANGIQDYVDNYIFDDELVLVAEDGGHFGSKTKPIAYRVSGKCWINNHAHVLKPKDLINVDYLCYALMFCDTSCLIKGATRQKLNQKDLRNIKIPNLNINQQLNIVKDLKSIFKIIEIKQNNLILLDELIKSRFIEMFGTIDRTRCKVKRINELCEFVKDGTHQTPKYTDDKINGFIFLSSKDVTSGKIDWSNTKFIPPDLHEKLYKTIAPQKGDILLAKNGTTGRAAIVDKDETFDIYVSLAILRFKKENNPKFMLYAINNDDTKRQFNDRLKGVGVPNLHLGEIKLTKLIVPSIELQNNFVAFAEEVDKSKFIVQQQIKDLQELLNKKMDEYFGE